MVSSGVGNRSVFQQTSTIQQARLTRQHRSTPTLLDNKWQAFKEVDLLTDGMQAGSPCSSKPPALLIADSMGDIFDASDPMFRLMIKVAYTPRRVTDDIEDDLVDLQYENVILWFGAHALFRINFDTLADDVRSLINAIRLRNKGTLIAVSTLIPKPRENHIAQDPIARYNAVLAQQVASFDQVQDRVVLLSSHSLFLDDKGDIVRPIMENFEDGFHLNRRGMNKLRNFWIQQLELS